MRAYMVRLLVVAHAVFRMGSPGAALAIHSAAAAKSHEVGETEPAVIENMSDFAIWQKISEEPPSNPNTVNHWKKFSQHLALDKRKCLSNLKVLNDNREEIKAEKEIVLAAAKKQEALLNETTSKTKLLDQEYKASLAEMQRLTTDNRRLNGDNQKLRDEKAELEMKLHGLQKQMLEQARQQGQEAEQKAQQAQHFVEGVKQQAAQKDREMQTAKEYMKLMAEKVSAKNRELQESNRLSSGQGEQLQELRDRLQWAESEELRHRNEIERLGREQDRLQECCESFHVHERPEPAPEKAAQRTELQRDFDEFVRNKTLQPKPPAAAAVLVEHPTQSAAATQSAHMEHWWRSKLGELEKELGEADWAAKLSENEGTGKQMHAKSIPEAPTAQAVRDEEEQTACEAKNEKLEGMLKEYAAQNVEARAKIQVLIKAYERAKAATPLAAAAGRAEAEVSALKQRLLEAKTLNLQAQNSLKNSQRQNQQLEANLADIRTKNAAMSTSVTIAGEERDQMRRAKESAEMALNASKKEEFDATVAVHKAMDESGRLQEALTECSTKLAAAHSGTIQTTPPVPWEAYIPDTSPVPKNGADYANIGVPTTTPKAPEYHIEEGAGGRDPLAQPIGEEHGKKDAAKPQEEECVDKGLAGTWCPKADGGWYGWHCVRNCPAGLVGCVDKGDAGTWCPNLQGGWSCLKNCPESKGCVDKGDAGTWCPKAEGGWYCMKGCEEKEAPADEAGTHSTPKETPSWDDPLARAIAEGNAKYHQKAFERSIP